MAKPITTRQAPRGSTSYAAGLHLHKHGASTERELFAAIPFGSRSTAAADVLQRALRSNWLVVESDGKIGISAFARAHYDKQAGEEKVESVEQIAALRQPPNIFGRPPLSKKYIPNPRGIRQDIPEWSVRSGASFKTVAGGGA